MGKLLLFSVAFLAIAAMVPPSKAQERLNPGSASKMLSWDVVSVRPNHSLDPSQSMRMTSDGVEVHNMTLDGLFINAFEIRGENQIVGYPSWVNSEHFDIQAKMDAETVAAYHALKGEQRTDEWRSLIRQILQQRFDLKYHVENRVLPVYFLVVTKQGSKLKESANDGNSSTSMGAGKLSGHRWQMSGLAFSLSGVTDRMVIDKTDLKGDYDLELSWSPDDSADSGLSLFTALQEQLGLKLEPAKAPVDVIVVDHIERPSAN